MNTKRTMKVYLIGAGPGDPGLFTLKGKAVLEKADVVIYDYLANEDLLEYARPDAEIIYAGKKGGDHTMPQEAINALIVSKAKEGNIVARLKGGDPYMFGRGGEEGEAVLEAGIPFEVVPAVSSAQAATAYAGIPLTHRSFASSVCFATGHEDPAKPETAHDWKSLARGRSTLVFFMGMKNLPEISRKLIEAGMPEDTPAALVHWGTTARHRSLAATIKTLPQAAKEHGFAAPSLIVVGQVVALKDTLGWFEHKPLLGKTIVVTRAREQGSDTAKLLAEEGARVIQFPTITVAPLQEHTPVREVIGKLSEYQWVLFTSANGVRYFWEQLEAVGQDARAFGQGNGIKVAAIGEATARALRGRGIVPDFVPESYVAESMAKGLLAACGPSPSGLRMLLPRAKEARDVLPDELGKHGIRVDILPVYETRPSGERREEVLALLQAGEVDCITFGSSSTVTNFLSLIPAQVLREHSETKLACIGPITAATLEKAGLACSMQPKEHSIPGLVKVLIDAL